MKQTFSITAIQATNLHLSAPQVEVGSKAVHNTKSMKMTLKGNRVQ